MVLNVHAGSSCCWGLSGRDKGLAWSDSFKWAVAPAGSWYHLYVKRQRIRVIGRFLIRSKDTCLSLGGARFSIRDIAHRSGAFAFIWSQG